VYIEVYVLYIILSYTTFHIKTLKCTPKFFGVPIKRVDMKDAIYLNNIIHLSIDAIYYSTKVRLPNVIYLHKRQPSYSNDIANIKYSFPNMRIFTVQDMHDCKELVHLECESYKGKSPPNLNRLKVNTS
jgi:hypothetical protein